MARTGLTLRPTPLATVEQLGRRQQDWVLVSEDLKTIAIVDLNRPSEWKESPETNQTNYGAVNIIFTKQDTYLYCHDKKS